MRKPLLMAGIILLLIPSVSRAQINLSWLTSFLPAWADGNTSGSAITIGGYSLNCSVSLSMTGGGTYVQALGSSGSMTPTVTGATFTVPGSLSRLQVTPNFATNTSYLDMTFTFNSPVTNVNFRIVDIDKSSSTSNTYYDKVTIWGANGPTNYNPTITKYDATTDPNFLVISGNSAWVNTSSGQGGNTDSDLSDQRGTINVNFGTTALKSVTVRYGNASGAQTNPASQAIAIGTMSFTQSTLPVSLTNFSGHRESQNVLLNWTTAQENNSDHFEIERNDNGIWQTIGTVAAAGNSTSDRQYNFTDLRPQGNTLLYRLKYVDIDGQFKYSAIVRIDSKNTMTDLRVYPNPFVDQLGVSVTTANGSKATIIISDAGGRIVSRKATSLFPGSNTIMVSGLQSLASGTYQLELVDDTGAKIGSSRIFKN